MKEERKCETVVSIETGHVGDYQTLPESFPLVNYPESIIKTGIDWRKNFYTAVDWRSV